jgi:hypothetical protein
MCSYLSSESAGDFGDDFWALQTNRLMLITRRWLQVGLQLYNKDMESEPQVKPLPRQKVNTQSVQQAILGEIWGVMGRARWSRGLVGTLFSRPAARLAELLVRLEEDTAQVGFTAGARNLLDSLVEAYQVECQQAVPVVGPLLAASNHVGGFDVILVAASLGRDDLKIISSEISLMRVLPCVAEHFIEIGETTHQRMAAFRTGLRHLRDGKALLYFPRGEVESDPAYFPQAVEEIEDWSPSLGLFLRKTGEIPTVFATVSGILSPAWFNHPLVRLWRRPEQRRKVAEIIQVAEQLFLSRKARLAPRVSFSEPWLPQDGDQAEGLMREAVGRAQAHMREHMRLFGYDQSD